MRMLELKPQTHFLTHHACRRMTINDAVVEWIDIIFEDATGVAYCSPHSHDWFEFNYVAAGSMETAFEDGIMRTMDAGTFILIPPGAVHSHTYDPVSPHEGLCLRWRLERRAQMTTDSEAKSDEITVYDKLLRLKNWTLSPMRDDIGLADRLERLLAESEAGEQAIFVQMTFIRFLMRLAEAVSSSYPALSAESATDGLTRKVDIFLNDLQDRQLDVKKLAASLHLSYAHVAREFKRRTGQTIVGRLTEIRLNKAIEYLVHKNMTIKEIAEKAGFASVYYFSRVFKKSFDLSPTQYRAEKLRGSALSLMEAMGDSGIKTDLLR